MGCLFLLIMMLSPRLGIIFLWLFTNWVNLAFNSFILPALGLVFLPWTTLLYILVAAPAGGITFWGWLFVALGLINDIAAHSQAYASRNQAQSMYQQQFGT
jgi:hypothetical protein